MLNPKQTYKDIVIRHVYNGLLEGRFNSGDKVLENTLSMELGLSRAPVREGLRDLVHSGILEYRPQVGNFVATLSPDEIVDAYVTRGVLEGYAAREALPHITAKELDFLEEKAARMEEAAIRNRKRELVDLGERFHKSIFRHCGNAQLNEYSKQLSLKLHLLFHRHWGYLYTPAEISMRHQKIVTALRLGDPQQVEEVVRDHYFATGRRIAELQTRKPGPGKGGA